MKKLVILISLLLSACVYRLDIQQGNILDQKDIDKLRPGLSKEQVVFVLGNPVLQDSFADDQWLYLYTYHNKNLDTMSQKKLELEFQENSLISAKSDSYTIPETLKKD